MDIRDNIVKKLNKLYNFVLDHEIFDRITILVIGKTVKETKTEQVEHELQTSNELLLDTLVSEYDNETHRGIARQLLRNQLEYISINQSTEIQKDFLMVVAANIINQLMVLDGIIGIQPLCGPSGTVYHMQLTKMLLEIITHTVHTTIRTLPTKLSVEVLQDLKSCNKLDIEAELSKLLSYEIVKDLFDEVLKDLVSLAEQNPVSETVLDTSSDSIIYHINRVSAYIAKNTRRGSGNVIITSPIGVALLRSNKQIKFIPCENNELNKSFTLGIVGYLTLDSNVTPETTRYKVYSSLSPSLLVEHPGDVKFLIAYRGKSATDVGYVDAPYVPVMPSGIHVDPMTFRSYMQITTQCGEWFKKEKESQDINKSSDYFALLTVKLDDE